MKSIPLYKFYKHKYGNELLIDVIDIDVMKADISQTSVYCTCRLSIQRPAVLLRWVFGCSPPNRTYTFPRIRLSTNNISLFIVNEIIKTITAQSYRFSFTGYHILFQRS